MIKTELLIIFKIIIKRLVLMKNACDQKKIRAEGRPSALMYKL